MKSFLILCLLLPSPAWSYLPGHFYNQKRTNQKIIALTFDDGPGHSTPEFLKLLRRHQIRGTFYLQGSQVKRFPDIARRIVIEGHEVGNHTYTHANFHLVQKDFAKHLYQELDRTEAAIEKATGIHCQSVRMPNGYYSHKLMALLKQRQYALVHWSYGSDWIVTGNHGKMRTAEDIARDYVAEARPGAVFLFHDGPGNRARTLRALKLIIDQLKKKDYVFITAGQMFADANLKAQESKSVLLPKIELRSGR